MPKQPPTTNPDHDFKKIIESFRYQHNTRQLFIDWLEIAACAIHQEPYHLGFVPQDADFAKIESQYLATVKKYNRDELDAFAKLLAITKLALWQEKTDFLGKLYTELEISNDRNGEFFTPYPLSLMTAKMILMTAKMILGDIAPQIHQKGFITVAEPACGAGGMIIAVAQIVEEQGYDPGAVIFFDAIDISRACFNMTYLQCAILGLSAYVRHANTLSLEQWEGRFTPICRVYPRRTQRFLTSLKASAANKPTPADRSSTCSLPLGGLGWGSPLHQTPLFDLTPTQHKITIPHASTNHPKQHNPLTITNSSKRHSYEIPQPRSSTVAAACSCEAPLYNHTPKSHPHQNMSHPEF